jgi:hypothetical protein
MKSLHFLPLLNAAIVTDLAVILLLLFGAYQSTALRQWYQKFGLGAMIADVLILVIGVLIAYYLYKWTIGMDKYNLWLFMMYVVAVQLIHDLLFGKLVGVFYRSGSSDIMETFKVYIKEKGGWILLADALMMISTVLFEQAFSKMDQTGNILLLIGLVYASPYIIFSA